MLGHWLANEKSMFLFSLYMRINDKIFMTFRIYLSFPKGLDANINGLVFMI